MISPRVKMRLAFLIDTAGSALTWTGLPAFVAQYTGESKHLGGLFLTETVAAIGISFFSGYLSDRFNRKLLTLVTNYLCAALMIFLWASFLLQAANVETFYIVGFLLGVIGNISSTAASTWYSSLGESSQLERHLASLGSMTMGAKILGMAFGPVLFHLLGAHAILFDAVSFLGANVLLSSAPIFQVSRNENNLLREQFSLYKSLILSPRYYRLLTLVALHGLLGFPLLTLIVTFISNNLQGSESALSLFWLIGGLGSLVVQSVLTLKRIHEISRATKVACSAAVFALAILLFSVSSNLSLIFVATALMTISNPIMGILINAELFRSADSGLEGRVMACAGIFSDLGSLLGLGLVWMLTPETQLPIGFLLFLPFVLLRWLTATPLFKAPITSAQRIPEYV